jgi:cytochrome c biogenesis protein CcmG/thiol:disulfide interchange protein DsbE
MNRVRTKSGGRTWVVVVAVAVVAVIAAVIAFAAAGGDDSSSGTSSAQSGSTTTHETGPVAVAGATLPRYGGPNNDGAVGHAIPTLSGESFDGSKISIGPTGEPQVVMFVAHWCPHCQAEVPRVVDLAKQGAFDGLGVSTVATGTNPNYPNYPPSAWLAEQAWPFPVMADSTQSTAAEAYGLSAYPFFVFVSADGKVAGRATGEISPDDLTKILDALRAGKALPTASGANSSAT